MHFGIVGTLFELLSLWFLAGFLEAFHDANWVTSLYAVSVLGTAAAALVLYLVSSTHSAFAALERQPTLRRASAASWIAGGHRRFLYGDTQFLMFFVIGIQGCATLAIIYAIVAVAMLFSQEQDVCFLRSWAVRSPASLFVPHGAAAHRIFFHDQRKLVRPAQPLLPLEAPARAARKFEVYMRSQGRTVKFDGQGNRIDEDADDKKRWN